jgi:hypothetical protein
LTRFPQIGIDLPVVLNWPQQAPPLIAALTALNHQIEARSKRLKNPHPPDSLAWAAWIIGRLCGWDGYPSSKPPGPITFKHGLEYFHAVAAGWSLRDLCMH